MSSYLEIRSYLHRLLWYICVRHIFSLWTLPLDLPIKLLKTYFFEFPHFRIFAFSHFSLTRTDNPECTRTIFYRAILLLPRTFLSFLITNNRDKRTMTAGSHSEIHLVQNKMKTENRSTCPILAMQRDVRVLFSSETVCNMSFSLLPFSCIYKHFRKNIILYYYYIIKIYLMYIVHNIFTNIY